MQPHGRNYTPREKPRPGQTLDYGHPLGRGMVAAWLFNEGAGSVVADMVAGRNPLSMVNAPVFAGDRLGSGLKLTAASSQLAVIANAASKSDVMFTADYTIVCRYRASAGTGIVNNTSLISRWASGQGWMTITASSGFRIYTDGVFVGFTSTPTADDKPHHVVLTKDGITGRLTIDGNLFGSASGLSATISANGATPELEVGNYSARGGSYFDGVYDHIYLYNRAMTPSDAAWLNAEPFSMFLPPRLVRSYSIATAAFQAAWAKGSNRLISGGVSVG